MSTSVRATVQCTKMLVRTGGRAGDWGSADCSTGYWPRSSGNSGGVGWAGCLSFVVLAGSMGLVHPSFGAGCQDSEQRNSLKLHYDSVEERKMSGKVCC